MSVPSSHAPSPILVGRDDLLALGRRRVEAARAGQGHLLFLAGEAGIGKTRLLGAITREAARHGMRTVQAATAPRDVEIAGGLLLDLAHGLTGSGDEADARIGRTMLDELRHDTPSDGDVHRRRRLVVLELADRVAGLAGADRPVLLALEDLHWADGLSLDVIAHLARRLSTLPMLVVGTYRSDELVPGLPMRAWRSTLVTQRRAEEAKLARLGRDETARMASLILGDELPPARDLVDELMRRTDGIPLHVEEILHATAEVEPGGPPPDVPDTLVDAVLARRAQLGEEAAEAVDAAAAIGRSFDLDLLAAALDRTVADLGPALEELEGRAFLVRSGATGWLDLRHALIRDALAAAIPAVRRRELHTRIAMHARTRPELSDDAFLSGHFEQGGRSDEAFRHALRAAQRAVVLSAHREALDLYRRAVRCAPGDLAPVDRARLVAARGAEEAATDDNAAAAASFDEARRILLAIGRRGDAADLVPPMVAARHLLGDDLAGRVALLDAALSDAAAAGDGGEAAEVRDARTARIEAGLAAAYMLDRRLDESMEHGRRAIDHAARAGAVDVRLNAMTTLGSVLVFAGRMDAGWELLDAALASASAARLEAEAARTYRMIGSSASVLVEYERAEAVLRDGIAYAERTEQWNHRHYMAAHLGHVLWATGAWEEAVDVTEHALSDGRGGITTRVTALHVLGYVAIGRGDWDAAASALGEARRIGEEMRELQRTSPAIWGLAESALLQGRHREAADLCEEGYRASLAVADAAYLFPFLVTGTRALLALRAPGEARDWVDRVEAAVVRRSIPGTLPAVAHGRGLLHLAGGATGRARGALEEARDGWRARRRTWEMVQATVDLARVSHRSNRPAQAAALLDEAAAEARRIGSPTLESVAAAARPRRREDAASEPWAPLTAREYEVARLIADGRTNAEIAEELTIAPKTVAAHVEHILAKLGAERRTEIAAWVGRLGSDES